MKKILFLGLVAISEGAFSQSVQMPCTGTISNGQLGEKATQAVVSTANGGNGGSNLAGSVTGQLTDCANSQAQSWLNNLLSTDRGVTEISGNFIQRNSPTWGILLVRPLTETDDHIHTTFIQGSVFRQADRTTTNLGLGYRQLLADKKVLVGVNAFYDYEFPYGNQRGSLGAEFRTSVAEINANYYQGMSGWVNAANGLQEKSLGGYDAELAIAMPYIPSAYVRAKTFRWLGVDGLSDVYGAQYSLTGAIGWGLGIEAGRVIYGSGQSNNNFMKLSWTLGGDRSSNQKQFKFREVAYSLDSMEDRRFEKVRRENLIVKAEKSGSFTFAVKGF